MIITVLRCIGCGAISTPHPCVGACVDRRLDLVDADEHAAAAAALAERERLLGERRALVERLAQAPDEFESLRAQARAAPRSVPAVAGADAVTTWECQTCGRIEAPQECIGVCVRPELRMVPADEHAALLERAAAVDAQLARLAVPLRLLAWTRPRPDHRDEGARALRAAAQTAL